MPHTLYTCGLGQPPHGTHPTPTLVRSARRIRVLWASWCDALVAYQSDEDEDGGWSVEYSGAGLRMAQKAHVEEEVRGALAVSGGADADELRFFGSAMHEGLRGLVSQCRSEGQQKVIIFATDGEMETGEDECAEFVWHGEEQIVGVTILSGGHVLLSVRSQSASEGHMLHLLDMAALRRHLSRDLSTPQDVIAEFAPQVLAAGATTATALDKNGQVFTFTRDPRYPRCLGRPSGENQVFQSLPYLEETRVVKISAGGYMTAVISADGELFIWGQASPGTAGELNVLNETPSPANTDGASASDANGTWITGVPEQDEFVKCLQVQVAGKEAIVSDVAVGFGHMLVAAAVSGTDRNRAVLAAGCGSHGQLGLGPNVQLQRHFEEIVALRGKHIVQLVSAGWSSLFVVDE